MSWKYFKVEEFACKHCGENLMDHKFVDKLDVLRTLYGKSLIVNSGYRCPAHNSAVSSTGGSGPHTTGRAVDFKVDRGDAVRLLEEAMGLGTFTGFGIQQKGQNRFIHLDDLPNTTGQPRPTIWTY